MITHWAQVRKARTGEENAARLLLFISLSGFAPLRFCMGEIMTEFLGEIKDILADGDITDAEKAVQIDELLAAAVNDAEEKSYQAGYDECEQDHANDEPPCDLLDDLETGLRLIDTDRTAAKVYLDRCTKQAGKHLIEVAPCLL